jgi:uncharacterized DUF497 family protein
MLWLQFIWDDPNDPDGNVEHIAEHGLTIDEVEYVLNHPSSTSSSDSSGSPCCFGYTPSGEYIIVVYEQIDDDSVQPVTAYHVPEP